MLLGCTGEVGSRLTLSLVNLGIKVFGTRSSRECKVNHPLHSCIEVNLLESDIKLEIESIKPELLIHAAWYTEPINFWESSQNFKWTKSSQKIIDVFKKSGGRYLIVTGSCGEYSWNSSKSLSESSLEEPASTYGKARLELLKWVRNQNLPFLWTRTFFQFGMNEATGRLIPSLIDSFLVGKPYIIRKPLDVRDFVYIEDVVQILSDLIRLEHRGVVNIGSGVGVRTEKMAIKIAELMNSSKLLRLDRTYEISSSVVSNSQNLTSLIGDYSWVPLDEALQKSIQARMNLENHDALQSYRA